MLRVTTTMTGLSGAPYYSTQYFEGTEAAEAAAVIPALHTFWTSIKGYITSGLTIDINDEVEVVNIATGQVENTHSVASVPITSSGNAALPKSTQGLLRLRTSSFVNGRRLLGRIFIPALANDAQLTGIPSTGFMSTLATAGNALITDTAGGNHEFGVYSVTHRTFAPVTSVSTWNQFAVLRSRRD